MYGVRLIISEIDILLVDCDTLIPIKKYQIVIYAVLSATSN